MEGWRRHNYRLCWCSDILPVTMVSPRHVVDKINFRSNQFHHRSREPFIARPRRKSGWRTLSSKLRRIAVFVIALQCVGLLFCYHPEWIHDFLKGPKTPYQPPSSEKQYRRPEDPRPLREKLFNALTRKQRKALQDQKQNFQQLKDSKRLTPCRLDGDCSGQKTSFLQYFRGSTRNNILVHNPLPQARYLCAKKILGGGTIELDDVPSLCQVSYLYSPHPPPISGKGMNAIELYWNAAEDPFYYDEVEEQAALATEPFECPIPCRSNGQFSIISTLAVKDTKWEITMTMEGEEYYSEAHYRRKYYQNDKYYALTSFQSEIPVPYFSWAEYKINHPPVNFDKVIKGASFLANNCDSMSNRESLVKGLIETKLRVDALSSCFRNAEPPPGVNMDNKTAILEQYLFHLAYENQRSVDYITEKLWGALAAGTLPVYYGAPNIKDHVPPHSVVFADDFKSPTDLSDYLLRLTKDRPLYESYHTWRSKPMDPAFMEKYTFTNTHSTCRMCKWAYAKKHGLDWNHSAQEVQEPYIPHRTCRNKHGLVSRPFKEFWLSQETGKAIKVTSEDATKTCNLDDTNRLLTIGGFRRRVYDQDGITDLIIDRIEGQDRFVLKLEIPVMGDQLMKKSGQEWWLQDSQSRFTLLTSKNTTVTATAQGTVQIPVTSSLRVRVIMENIDTFHKKATKRETYFGELMKKDFFIPLNIYRVH
jgi:hypothetical protein